MEGAEGAESGEGGRREWGVRGVRWAVLGARGGANGLRQDQSPFSIVTTEKVYSHDWSAGDHLAWSMECKIKLSVLNYNTSWQIHSFYNIFKYNIYLGT